MLVGFIFYSFILELKLACLHGAFHCGEIVAFGRLWLFICWVTLEIVAFSGPVGEVVQELKATMDCGFTLLI